MRAPWRPAIKLSDSPEKVPNPGDKHVWRVYDRRDHATADVVSLGMETLQAETELVLRHPTDSSKARALRPQDVTEVEPLLIDVLREGDLVYDLPTIDEMRALRERDVARLDSGVKRLVNPHIYHVSLTPALWKRKRELMASVAENGV